MDVAAYCYGYTVAAYSGISSIFTSTLSLRLTRSGTKLTHLRPGARSLSADGFKCSRECTDIPEYVAVYYIIISSHIHAFMYIVKDIRHIFILITIQNGYELLQIVRGVVIYGRPEA